jgi:hypothetical protein
LLFGGFIMVVMVLFVRILNSLQLFLAHSTHGLN